MGWKNNMTPLDELKGLVQQMEGLAQAAEADPERAHLFHAALAQAWAMLAASHWRQGDVEAAMDGFDRAIALQPLASWQICRAALLPAVPGSRQEISEARNLLRQRLETLQAQPPGRVSTPSDIGWTLFLLAYHAEEDNRALHRLFHDVCLQACPELGWSAPHCQEPRRPGRTRVGFISWHLTDHTIARLFLRLVEELDADSFDVTLFSFEGRDAAVAPMPGKRHISLPPDHAEARQRIAAAELDLLIHLDLGMDYLTLFLAYSRLARRQGVLWGHPDSLGLDSIDYVFSPDCMEPDGADAHYNERLIRLPGTVALYDRPVLPAEPKGRAEMGLPEEGLLFLCPQTPFKFHPDFDPALVRILDGVEGSRLVLLAGWEAEAMELVKARITRGRPDLEERILILGQLARADFLTLFMLCDLVLDPFHYSGGNSSLEGFAVGSPIVTWPGKYMRARHTAGFYHLMGLDDLVARDHEDYIALAIRLGQDPAAREAVRSRILGACGLLYDDRRGLWALEAFITLMGR